jgi:alpha-beta hydrolase superfamily lysophospholipase
MLVPPAKGKIPVALLIAGSGPTDRDGNNPRMKNNALKMLAEALYKNGIASLRYDKRGIGASKPAGLKESELRFDTYIRDAVGWVQQLKQDKRFSSLVVIGHSQGSLIGMVAAQNPAVDKFISLEGAGEPIYDVLRKQLENQPDPVRKPAYSILDSLENGHRVKNVPPMLQTLFRPSIQPYLISWFRYHPQEEIAKLHKPVLIVQGTTDIQVSQTDAENLKKADPAAKLLIIKGMNHILKNAPANRQQNIKTYFDPDLPLNKELVEGVVKFIKE